MRVALPVALRERLVRVRQQDDSRAGFACQPVQRIDKLRDIGPDILVPGEQMRHVIERHEPRAGAFDQARNPVIGFARHECAVYFERAQQIIQPPAHTG